MIKCPICGSEVSEFKKPKKTLQQLRFHYGVVLQIIAKEIGYEKWELPNLHYELKEMFLTNTFISKITGGERQGVPSLGNITKQKMCEYLDEVIRWAGKQGIVVPDPKEYYKN